MQKTVLSRSYVENANKVIKAKNILIFLVLFCSISISSFAQDAISSQNINLTERTAALQAKYNSGRRQQITGNILWISGIIAFGGGLGVMASAIQEKNDDAAVIGALAVFSGGLLFNTGIPIAIVGTARKGHAYRAMKREGLADFNDEYVKKAATTPKLRLNLHGNGAGFAYVF